MLSLPVEIENLISRLHSSAFFQGALEPGTRDGYNAERNAFAAADELRAAIVRLNTLARADGVLAQRIDSL